jgi:predicted nucleic-acid-binding protein
VKITPDTNVLVRLAVADDPRQLQLAIAALQEAQAIAVTLPVLCEFAWVLRQAYKRSRGDIANGIRKLIALSGAIVERPAAEAGLLMLEAGGDFADGVIAFEGRRMGGEIFVSFDRVAAERVAAMCGSAICLEASDAKD